MTKLYDHPSEVCADKGEVIVEGPGGRVLSMTPDAALETSDRLLTRGLEAHGQNVSKELSRQSGSAADAGLEHKHRRASS